MVEWIDTHCHLDAPEFDADRQQVVANAQAVGVIQMVIPAVHPAHFERVVSFAHEFGFCYALGLHPMWMDHVPEGCTEPLSDFELLDQVKLALEIYADDPLFVAIGEVGLDYFVEGLDKDRQWFFYVEQLKLAKKLDWPVILHARRSADMLVKGLHQIGIQKGIAHAFNGSLQQAQALIGLGLKLGFGGACTFERARQIRQLASAIPITSIVLETDAPDMPPQWIYKTARARLNDDAQVRNEPAELARIAEEVAGLRGVCFQDFAAQMRLNVYDVFPRMVRHEASA